MVPILVYSPRYGLDLNYLLYLSNSIPAFCPYTNFSEIQYHTGDVSKLLVEQKEGNWGNKLVNVRWLLMQPGCDNYRYLMLVVIYRSGPRPRSGSLSD